VRLSAEGDVRFSETVALAASLLIPDEHREIATIMTITEDIVREAFLPFALPAIGEDEIAEVVDTLRSGWVTTGPKVKLFEDRFAEYTRASNAIALNSCTAGLHLALAALGLQVQMLAAPTLMGTLRTRANKPILVNGNKASSGTTILSGARIQSPDKVGATVDLASLGRLDFAPNTDFIVTFDAGNISVRLKAGYVVLTTRKGISGVVTMPDGKALETDSSKASSVIARTAGALEPEASVPIGAAGELGTAGAQPPSVELALLSSA
jgi:hypothetical protein